MACVAGAAAPFFRKKVTYAVGPERGGGDGGGGVRRTRGGESYTWSAG